MSIPFSKTKSNVFPTLIAKNIVCVRTNSKFYEHYNIYNFKKKIIMENGDKWIRKVVINRKEKVDKRRISC